jgi:hypothetical protein
MGVSVSGGTMTVTLDGRTDLSAPVKLPANVLAGFTAGNGVQTDRHTLSNVAIVSGTDHVPPPGGGWSFNGRSAMMNSDTQLTPALTRVAGTVVYPVAVPTAGLNVAFNAQLTGGDGLTFALLSRGSSATAVGGASGDLGFGGLTGIAAAFVTRKDAGFRYNNFAGVSGGTNTLGTHLVFQVVARAVPPLQGGTHNVVISVTTSRVLIVYLDGTQVFQQAEPSLPSTAMLAFTASTSTERGLHFVRDVAITAP